MYRPFIVFCQISCFAFSACDAEEPASNNGIQLFQQLISEYETQEDQYRTKREESSDEELDRLFLKGHPINTMVDRFLSLEKSERGTLVGLSCLHHLVQGYIPLKHRNGPVAFGDQAALVLLKEHYWNHPALDRVLPYLNSDLYAGAFHREETIQLFKTAMKSTHPHVRCAAHYYLAEYYYLGVQLSQTRNQLRSLYVSGEENSLEEGFLNSSFQFLQKLEQIDARIDAESSREKAVTLLRSIEENYADVPLPLRDWEGPVLLNKQHVPPTEDAKKLAQRMRFILQRCVIGQTAPELNQPDAFGNPLHMRPESGKVTVIFFSFKGCGPCEAMYPDVRRLLKDVPKDKLQVLGIMNDETVETVKQAVDENQITWPVWWEGPERPISEAWGVTIYPSIFVLDHQGVIRFKQTRPPLLERAVNKLLVEAESTRKN